MTSTDTKARPGRRTRRGGSSHATSFTRGFFVKLALMGVVNALGLYIVLSAWQAESWGVLTGMVLLLVAANYVYFSSRPLPLKYILPGVAFLLVYQVFVIAYTGYIAFTNYGEGHNSTKEDAIEVLLAQNERRVPETPTYPLVVLEADGALDGLLGETELGFAILDSDSGEVLAGTSEQPLEVVADAVLEDERIVEVPGFEVLDRTEVLERQGAVTSLRVPWSEDPQEGSVRTQDAISGFVAVPNLVYDEQSDTMTNTETGVVYYPNEQGQFESEDGQSLAVGWRVFVGFDNFVEGLSDTRTAGPFFSVLAWTVAFALASVGLTFLLGMFLAIVFNDERLRGRKIYRVLVILPYAFPGFLSALLFAGLLNRRFGFINTVLLGGADIPWLTDPWLAKFSVIGVNLWLGFPYMFLVCTGALQSIPKDTLEAAAIDGAGRVRRWWAVTLPMLMVSTAPLLISTFAFNFNNFNLIYMLTGGGPRIQGIDAPIGHTDILITMVYKVSGVASGQATNYGLAAAMSLVIFLIVALIAVVSFRRTRALEDIH